jgi:hypothetical protein
MIVLVYPEAVVEAKKKRIGKINYIAAKSAERMIKATRVVCVWFLHHKGD